MPGPFPLRAPTPLDYFESLVADDASLPLLETAIALAHDEFPQLDTNTVLAAVDALAARLKARLPDDAVPMQRLRWLNRFFFQELGFAGNVNDYYDPRNSFLHIVLETRRGIPITLAMLYIELASQIGLVASGVSFPGHFLARLRMPQGDVIIDPFTGQSMSREALDGLLAPYRRPRGAAGEAQLPLALFLQPAAPREVIARMLRNLKEIHRNNLDWARVLAVQHRLVILLPDAWDERRDRGLAYAEIGASAEAVADLRAYLERVPDAADRFSVNERLMELGHGDPSRLH